MHTLPSIHFTLQSENKNENFDQTLRTTLFVQSPLESVDTWGKKNEIRVELAPDRLRGHSKYRLKKQPVAPPNHLSIHTF